MTAPAAAVRWQPRHFIAVSSAVLAVVLAPALNAVRTGGLFAALALASSAPAIAQASHDISPAETLLFQTRHLGNVPATAVLLYAYHKQGGREAGFDDEVRLVREAGKGSSVRFLSGPRRQPVADIDNAEGNPVLLAFLEHDIAEMHRLTGGSSSYFRKRIRLALADAAQVQARHFVYLGKRIDGREVSIEPYRNDPMHARFESYTSKRYIFLLSEDVPGGIYQLCTVVPEVAASADKAQPTSARSARNVPDNRASAHGGNHAPAAASDAGALDETLTLVGLAPVAAAPAK